MPKSKHDQIAEKLAKKFNTPYKYKKGIDIVTPTRLIEVESQKGTLRQGINQVVRSSKARYLAVPYREINNAIDATKGTGIGVINEYGKIMKKASRKRK